MLAQTVTQAWLLTGRREANLNRRREDLAPSNVLVLRDDRAANRNVPPQPSTPTAALPPNTLDAGRYVTAIQCAGNPGEVRAARS